MLVVLPIALYTMLPLQQQEQQPQQQKQVSDSEYKQSSTAAQQKPESSQPMERSNNQLFRHIVRMYERGPCQPAARQVMVNHMQLPALPSSCH